MHSGGDSDPAAAQRAFSACAARRVAPPESTECTHGTIATAVCKQAQCKLGLPPPSDPMHESTHTTATRHAPRIAPMVALARGLGAAFRTSVARIRPAESDVRGMSSTRSKTVGAVRQVRGGAEVGFWLLGGLLGGARRRQAACGGWQRLQIVKSSSRLV